MPRTTVPGASTLGVTAQDVDAARRERDRLVAAHEDATEKAQTRLTEMKEANGGTLPATAETRTEVEELFATADKLGAEVDGARDYLADLQGRAYGRDPGDRMPEETARQRGHGSAPSGQFSIAARLLQSDAYQEARASGLSGFAAFTKAVASGGGAIQVADRLETRALLSDIQAAATLEPLVGDDQRRLFPPADLRTEQVRLLDLISITETDKDNVDYAVTTNAQGNVIGAAYGAVLGTATITTEARAEAVKRRGTLLDVPEGVLSDEARVKTWLEKWMRFFVRLDSETQVLFGDGAGQNFTGIMNWAGVGARARGADPVAVAIHKAITDIRIAYFGEPNAVALRPETFGGMVEERASDGHYVNSGGPFSAIPTSTWGKQAVPTTLLRDGTGNAGADPLDAVVGYWPEAELAVREGTEVRDFEQNKDNIEKGMITFRSQYRSAFIVNQPTAFVALDLT